jgi:hypothetical protein
MAKAAILHEGDGYCKACWKKYFRPVPCQECGKPTSSYMGAAPVTCKGCRSKNRSCKGCGRTIPVKRIGKVFPDGSALCSRCVVQSAEPKKCPNCNNVTKHLIRDTKAGFNEPVCSSCRHRARLLITCGICGNKRHLSGEIDGKQVCFTCFQAHKPTVCPTCGKVRLSMSKSMCSDCEWKATVRKHAGELADSLSQPWCGKLFVAFTEDALETYGGYDTNLRFESNLPFFAAMDAAFTSVDNLVVDDVVRLFPVGEFSRYPLAYSFLVKRGLVVEYGVDDRLDALNLARQEKLLKSVTGKWYGSLMVEYHADLLKIHERYKERGWVGRRRRFTVKTVTLMLSLAIKFCEGTKTVRTSTQFENYHIEEYLTLASGNRELLSPFVRFLRTKRKTFARLKMPKKKEGNRINIDNIMSTERCNQLIRQWLNPPDSCVKQALICMLMLFYAQRPPRIVLMQTDHIFQEKDGDYAIVIGKKKTLQIHVAVGQVLTRYLEQREAAVANDRNNKYLFPGLIAGSHLSEISIRDYLRWYGVSSRELYATAMYRAVSKGVRLPSSLINAFSVSPKTAVAYLGLVDEQMDKDIENMFR